VRYKEALCQEMLELAKNPRVIFLGQQVGAEDFYGTLKDIVTDKRLEMPVAEELQLGMSIGLALEGYLPVSLYQRMDFLPRACDQLVNHLDLMEQLSQGRFSPHMIIRTTIGVSGPLDIGLQHKKDLIEGFKKLVHFPILKLSTAEEVHAGYKQARTCSGPIMLVEIQDNYEK
jgi:pyruvate/2-oxoglutarate/acetoin dehydrogenase E1 component